jgi:hemoglobin
MQDNSDSSNNRSLYEVLGGEVPLRQLVDAFYTYMDSLPEADGIRKMHQPDLSSANQKLFEFLSGWMGGPSLFTEKYGHPRLRARHLPFAIGANERDQWIYCMFQATKKCQTPAEFNDIFLPAIARLADHMRNQNEST